MSFGFSVSDFLAVGQLSWKVYKKCKDATGNYAELSSEVLALHAVIKETEELFSQQDLNPQQKDKLTTSRQGCEEVLKDLDGLLVKYKSLGTSAQRAWDRMGYGMQDMNSIRLRLISNVSMLDAFNNASSNARLEERLNLLIKEVGAGRREGSVISVKTFDQAAQDDRETWEALRRELEDIGISPSVITEKRQFIVTWFQGAVAAGQLEEDIPSEDNDSVKDVYESDASGVDRLSFNAQNDIVSMKGTKGPLPAHTKSGENQINGSDVYNIGRLPFETLRHTAPNKGTNGPQFAHGTSRNKQSYESVPQDSQIPKGLQAGRYEKEPSKNKRKWWSTVSFLFHMVRGIETQIIDAAVREDVDQVMRRLDRIADTEWKDINASSALLAAAESGEKAVMRVLLECAAPTAGALIWAAVQGNVWTLELITEYEVDINAEVNQKGKTALTVAIASARAAIVKLLLGKGANTELRNPESETALNFVARLRKRTMVQLLFLAGADTGAMGAERETAMKVINQQLLKESRNRVSLVWSPKCQKCVAIISLRRQHSGVSRDCEDDWRLATGDWRLTTATATATATGSTDISCDPVSLAMQTFTKNNERRGQWTSTGDRPSLFALRA